MGFSSDINLYISSSNVILSFFLSVSASRFFLAENSRGKEDGGERIYIPGELFYSICNSNRLAASVEEECKCLCVRSRASKRERQRGKQEEDESRRFHVWRVKTQSPGSVYRGYTSKLIFVSPIPPSGTAPNLGFSSIIPPFVSFIPFLLFISNNIRNSRAT